MNSTPRLGSADVRLWFSVVVSHSDQTSGAGLTIAYQETRCIANNAEDIVEASNKAQGLFEGTAKIGEGRLEDRASPRIGRDVYQPFSIVQAAMQGDVDYLLL